MFHFDPTDNISSALCPPSRSRSGPGPRPGWCRCSAWTPSPPGWSRRRRTPCWTSLETATPRTFCPEYLEIRIFRVSNVDKDWFSVMWRQNVLKIYVSDIWKCVSDVWHALIDTAIQHQQSSQVSRVIYSSITREENSRWLPTAATKMSKRSIHSIEWTIVQEEAGWAQ